MSTPLGRATFSAMLEQARKQRVPVMALRPDRRFPDEMDDIVVKDCDVHLEAMSDETWWMGCNFANGERVTFHFGISKKPTRLTVSVVETPDEWRDWDELYREAHGSEGTVPKSCSHCKGTGKDPDYGWRCKWCYGTGKA